MQQYAPNMIHAIAIATLLMCIFGCAFLFAILDVAHRKRIELLERKKMEELFREELLSSALEMQENTFRAVSREIHDNVGQLLSLAKLNLNVLSLESQSNRKLLIIKDLVSKAITALRNIGNNQSDQLLDLGLIAAIDYQVSQLRNTGIFDVQYRCEVAAYHVSRAETVFIYRIVQEAINNIIRHSAATAITMILSADEQTGCICIIDNGQGFDPRSHTFKTGIGLQSMQQRAKLIGAQVDIEPEPGKGTIVRILFYTNHPSNNTDTQL